MNPNDESQTETTAKSSKAGRHGIRVLRSKNWDQDSTLNLVPVIPAAII